MSRSTLVTRPQSGFTLIEVIIYAVLLGGIVTIASLLLLNVNSSRNQAASYQEVYANGRLVMERMTRAIREAEGVGGGSVFGSHPGTLVLDMPNTVNNATFDISSSRLRVTWTDTTTAFLTSDDVTVDNLVFTDFGDQIGIELTISKVNPTGRFEFNASADFSAFVIPRNIAF